MRRSGWDRNEHVMSEQASLTNQPPLAEGAVNGGDPSGETERAWVRDLADGQVVEAVFGVRERELRQRRNGGQWLRLVVCDSSGTVEVHISGRFGVHPQYGRKITVEAIRPARPEEFEGSDLADGPSVPVERLEADLRELLGTVQHPQLRELLDRLLDPGSPVWTRFREAPAAKYYHQAYRHGLLDHTAIDTAKTASG